MLGKFAHVNLSPDCGITQGHDRGRVTMVKSPWAFGAGVLRGRHAGDADALLNREKLFMEGGRDGAFLRQVPLAVPVL